MRSDLGDDPNPGVRGACLGARSCSVFTFLRFFVIHLLQPECPFTIIFQNCSRVQQSSCLDSLLMHCKETSFSLGLTCMFVHCNGFRDQVGQFVCLCL